MFVCLLLLWLQTAAAPQDPFATAREHIKKGYELSQKGDLRPAEAEFRQAVKLSPNDRVALAYLGIVLTRQGKLGEANGYFQRALNIEPGDIGTRYNLAVNQFRLNQPLEAKTNLERILKAKPDHKPAALMLGTILARLEDYQKAATLLESAGDLVRQHPESIVALARCYYQTNRRQQARDTLGRLLEPPSNPQAVFLGGQAAAQSGDLETAGRLLNSIRSTYPDRAKLDYEIALAQYNAGRFAESQRTLLELTREGTRRAEVYRLLAWCYHRQNRLPEAIAAMKEAIQLEPGTEALYEQLAQILIEQEHYTDAYEVVTKVLEAEPRFSRTRKIKCYLETRLGAVKQAAESCAAAAELNPEDPEAMRMLAVAQQNLRQYKEAAATFEKGIAKFPSDPQLCEAYGKMLLESRTEPDASAEARAVSFLKKALALDDSLAQAHYELGKYLLAHEKAEEALPHLQAATRLDPQNGKAHLALANAYRTLGRREEAVKELQLYKESSAESAGDAESPAPVR